MDTLYTKGLLRLAADAHGAGRLTAPDATGQAHSHMCGDRITIDLKLSPAGKISACGYDIHACVLTQAAQSLLAEAAIGRNQSEIERARIDIAAYLSADRELPDFWARFAGFRALRDHPTRHGCVLLPFVAICHAFDQWAEAARSDSLSQDL